MTSALKLAEKVQDMADDLEDEVEKGLDDGAEGIESNAREQVEVNDSDVHGNLKQSIRTREDVFSAHEVSRVVRAHVKYAPYVEFGTGVFSHTPSAVGSFDTPDPHPPVGNIRQWIVRKGIIPYAYDSGYLIEDQRNLAWAIAETIGELGNRPHPFMGPAYNRPSGKQRTVQQVARGVQNAISW